jgi:hypothetical protein
MVPDEAQDSQNADEKKPSRLKALFAGVPGRMNPVKTSLRRAWMIISFILAGKFIASSKRKKEAVPARKRKCLMPASLKARLHLKIENIRYFLRIPQDIHAALLKTKAGLDEHLKKVSSSVFRSYNTIAFGLIVIMIFCLLIFGGATDIMLTNYITTLIMLLLVVVLFGQTRVQERALDNYTAKIGLVCVKKCAAFPEKLRVDHVLELDDMTAEINKVKYVRITFGLINTGFAGILISNASLVLKMKSGAVLRAAPNDIVMSHVKPGAGHSSSITFSFREPVDFPSIREAEFGLYGNCSKVVTVRPLLYVNASAKTGKTLEIFEPWEKFRERMDMLKV